MTVHLWPVFSIYIYIILFKFLKFKFFFLYKYGLVVAIEKMQKKIGLPWIPTLERSSYYSMQNHLFIIQIEEHNQATNLSIALAIMVIYVDGWTILINYYLGLIMGENWDAFFSSVHRVFMKSSSKLRRVTESSLGPIRAQGGIVVALAN